jgi:broad specificity phosphatase PhoE
VSTTRTILVRHTEPESSAFGRCYGRLDVDLSERGRCHADAVGVALAEFGVQILYSSPLRRAEETARLIGARLELEPRVHAGLAEIDFGELEGRAYDEIAASEPALYRLWMERPTAVRFPGGESYSDLSARVADVLAEICGKHGDSVVAVVAHAGVIRAMLAPALGLRDDEVFAIPQEYGGVSIVDWSGECALVRIVNADVAAAGAK